MIRFVMLMMWMMIGCSCSPKVLKSPEEDTLNTIIFEDVVTGVFPDGYCAHDVGDDVCNLILKNQNDIIWSLHDQQGDIILLDFSVMWCGPCQSAAEIAEETQKKYEREGFQYVTVLIEDEYGEEIDRGDTERWADVFGIKAAPVLQGSRDLISEDLSIGWPLTSWPTMVIIDRNMVIHTGIHGYSEEWIINNIEDLL